jgi:hypothetical protein
MHIPCRLGGCRCRRCRVGKKIQSFPLKRESGNCVWDAKYFRRGAHLGQSQREFPSVSRAVLDIVFLGIFSFTSLRFT